MAPHIDHAVLFSGDGDFRRLVEAVQDKGVRVTVVSTLKSQPPQAADELRRAGRPLRGPADLLPDRPAIATSFADRPSARGDDDEL